MADHYTKTLVLGSGAAGCTAAIYAARAALSPVVVSGMQPGGQLTITTEVENFPGFEDPIQGPDLMERMRLQAEKMGSVFVQDHIVSVDLSSRPFVAVGDSGDRYIGETLIIATGASARWLGLESEVTWLGRGVSACATCDGFFFRDREVAVVGGGNSAVQEALYLSGPASRVTLIHRREALRAEKALQDRLFANPKIRFLPNRQVVEIEGGGMPPGVTGLRLRNNRTEAGEFLPVDGVFIAIGHTPNTGLFEGQLDRDDAGYIRTAPGRTTTNVPGVFAAGDVQDPVFRQAITAAGTGCMAALEALRFLEETAVS